MARHIQVLLVEDSEQERVVLRRQLSLADLAVIGESAFGQEAFTLARTLRPDAVLISMEQPVIRALRTMEIFSSAMPDIAVVALSTLNGNDDLRKAMVAGSREYVAKPIDAAVLRKAVHAAVESVEKRGSTAPLVTYDAPIRAGTIITVFGAKGGIGKSTVTTNLAVNLAHLTHQRVAILDLDHQFGATPIMLDLKPAMTLSEFREAADSITDETIGELMSEHHSGVSLLSLPTGPEALRYLDGDEVNGLLDILGRHYDYVLIDTPPSINEGVRAAMETSTIVLVLTSLEVACVKNTRDCLNYMREWEFFDDKVKLILNRPNASNGLRPEDIEEALAHPIVTKIPFDMEVAVATQLGKQIAFENPKNAAAQSFSEVFEAVTGTRPQPAPKTGLARLFGR